jgi:acyl-CoA synthetase (AMP-forming)/AMP-acid ligase II/acyl carrier protein
VTYRELARRSNRFANALGSLGVARTERVLVTTPDLYRRKVAGIRDELPELRHVVTSAPGASLPTGPEGTLDMSALMEVAGDGYEIGPTDAEDMALLHFTSGTTGAPKGAAHVHEAVVSHYATGRIALDLHPGDVYWCTADPGWVTGTSYVIVAPLAHGLTSVVDEAEFDIEHWHVTACTFGDGAVAGGEFHESMNLAALWRLPVSFCCENNLYAMGTALERAQSETDLSLRASSYRVPAWAVDGMDVLAVEEAARHAAEAVRDGGGPHFLELRTYRFRAHSMHDPVAPEADLDEVGPGDTLRETLDLGSIDFLNFVVGLHEATGIDIPERDYSRVATLAGCVAYLAAGS